MDNNKIEWRSAETDKIIIAVKVSNTLKAKISSYATANEMSISQAARSLIIMSLDNLVVVV